MIKIILKSVSRIGNILLLITIFLNTITILAQKTDKKSAFETRLYEFKYSLYATMDTIKDLNHFFSNPDTTHILYKLIKEFVNENKELVTNYQKNELKRFTKTSVNFENFEKDSIFFDNNRPKSEFVQLNEFYGNLDKTNAILQLMAFDPIYNAAMIKSIYLSHYHTDVDIGRSALMDKIALPKIKTLAINKNIWKIWFDHYSSLYEFTYHLIDNKMQLTGVYLQK